MAFILALTALILTLAHYVLAFTAPRTKSKLDDEGLVIVDKVRDELPGAGDK